MTDMNNPERTVPSLTGYSALLAADSRVVPDHFYPAPPLELGDAGVSTRVYLDPQHFQDEVEHVWSKIWQWACRDEDIPNSGDAFVYDNAGKSIVLVRQKDGSVKAFYNACMHRGRQLVDGNGNLQNLTCKYHGMSWRCDGRFRVNPLKRDFPQFEQLDMSLPEVRTGRWGGFIFINLDANAAPLEEVLGPLIPQFEPYDYSNRYTIANVSKVVHANWKVLAEAFMEGHHVFMVHPQALPFINDVDAQYDILTDDVSRHLTAIGVSSPMLAARNMTESDVLTAMFTVGARMVAAEGGAPEPDAVAFSVAEGQTARRAAAEMARQATAQEDGWDYSEASDAEMLDTLLYNVFPHQCFWAGYSQSVVYRFRPNGMDPHTSIMDVMLLKRVPRSGERPPAAPAIRLRDDQPWTDATNLGTLGLVIEQDMENMRLVQHGLKSSGREEVHFSRYAENRIRHLHARIARMIADGKRGSEAAGG